MNLHCRFRNITVAAIASLFIVLSVVFAPTAVAGPSTYKSGWVLTLDDEFNGTKLDPSVWNVTDNASYINNEQQYYTPYCVQVTHGYLRIKTVQKYYRGRSYVSGQINTQHWFTQRYGWFEARMRFPTTVGLWACFYLLPESGARPPKIDVAEYLTDAILVKYLGLTYYWQLMDYRVVNNSPVEWLGYAYQAIYVSNIICLLGQ